MSSLPAEGSSLERLRALLLDEGGLMASLVAPAAGTSDGIDGPAQLAASGRMSTESDTPETSGAPQGAETARTGRPDEATTKHAGAIRLPVPSHAGDSGPLAGH